MCNGKLIYVTVKDVDSSAPPLHDSHFVMCILDLETMGPKHACFKRHTAGFRNCSDVKQAVGCDWDHVC